MWKHQWHKEESVVLFKKSPIKLRFFLTMFSVYLSPRSDKAELINLELRQHYQNKVII